jgi:ABC-2 type transport system permease protein
MLNLPLFRHHFRQLIKGRGAPVFLAFGWVLTMLLVFVYGRFMAENKADLSALFAYAPWVMALMIPALTMGVADEPRRGVTERILTLPLTPWQRLGTRFSLYKLVVGFWVLGFWPLVGTVFYLGQPDVGPMVAGLVALWGLGVALTALSLAVALASAGAVGAFLGALALNLAVLLPGLNVVQEWGPTLMPPAIFHQLASLTPLPAFQTWASGQVTLGAFAVTVFWSLLGLLLAYLAQPRAQGLLVRPLPPLALAVGMVVALGLAAWPRTSLLQVDVTADGLHTLSPATITMLRGLQNPVTITLYASQNNPDAPPATTQTALAMQELLTRIAAAAPRQVHVQVVNPDASLSAAWAALEAGVDEQAVPGGTSLFLGVAVDVPATDSTPARHGVIGQLAPQRRGFQEFDLLNLIASTTQTHQPRLVVWGGEHAPASLSSALHGLTQLADVAHDPQSVDEISRTTNMVLLVGDPMLPSNTLSALQTYLASGGKVMLLAAETPSATLPQTEPEQDPTPEEDAAPFSTLLYRYGLKLNMDVVLGDTTHASVVTHPGSGAGAYPLWVRLGGSNINAELSFTSFIQTVLWPTGGVVQLAGIMPAGLSLTPVLSSSAQSQLASRALVAQANPNRAPTLLSGSAEPHPLAVMVSGNFVPNAPKPGLLIVFAGTQWLQDSFTSAPDNQNLSLFYNTVQYMLGQPELTTLRAKGATSRTLTRVESMFEGLTRANANAEQNILAQLNDVSELTSAANGNTLELQQKAFALRQQLRGVRQQVVGQIRVLEDALLVLNLLAMPLLMGIGFFTLRRL